MSDVWPLAGIQRPPGALRVELLARIFDSPTERDFRVASAGTGNTTLRTTAMSELGPDCVKTRMLEVLRAQPGDPEVRSYVRIAFISPPTPRMLITRFIL